jgi:hypothetical protein
MRSSECDFDAHDSDVHMMVLAMLMLMLMLKAINASNNRFYL